MKTVPIKEIFRDYEPGIPEEPLYYYCVGGYHPVHIADQFKNGRYQVLHKLGHGGYSTVWLAHDLEKSQLVSLKITVADTTDSSQEADILHHLSQPSTHPGSRHICHLLDHFEQKGPNGIHRCLVFDLLSVNVRKLVEDWFRYTRLPASVAWQFSKQITLAVDYLHSKGVVHGGWLTPDLTLCLLELTDVLKDIYTSNIMTSLGESEHSGLELLDRLDKPYQSPIKVREGVKLTENMPNYLVKSVNLPLDMSSCHQVAKLVDFGQAFFHDRRTKEVNTPLCFQAPELLMDSQQGQQTDIWALGCTLFDLVTGLPAFDEPFEPWLVEGWIEALGDPPAEWRRHPLFNQRVNMEAQMDAWMKQIDALDKKTDTDDVKANNVQTNADNVQTNADNVQTNTDNAQADSNNMQNDTGNDQAATGNDQIDAGKMKENPGSDQINPFTHHPTTGTPSKFININDSISSTITNKEQTDSSPKKQGITAKLREYYATDFRGRLEKGAPKFTDEQLECLGDLLTQMLRYRPEERITMDEVLKHPWFERNPFGDEIL